MPPDGPARASITAHGGVIVTASLQEAIDLANEGAAEHLVVDDDRLAARVRSAGSLFVGPWSAQVAGDYAIGSNHVLPTAGAARVRGGLSAADFVRQITVQRLTEQGLRTMGSTVMALAHAEGLRAHARSIEVRIADTHRAARAFQPSAKLGLTLSVSPLDKTRDDPERVEGSKGQARGRTQPASALRASAVRRVGPRKRSTQPALTGRVATRPDRSEGGRVRPARSEDGR